MVHIRYEISLKKEIVLMSVENKVKKIIAEKLGVDIEKVVPEASFCQ